MGGLSTRRLFAFGLAAAGAVPFASRLRFSSANAIEPAVRAVPIAPVIPKTFKAFGGVRIDNYDWLRDRKDPRVISYLDAENAYANARLEPLKPLVEELAAELKTREAQEDASVPATYNGYVYQHCFSQGAQYPCIVRHKDAPGAPQEEIVLDVGALAAAHPQQYQLGSWTVSPDSTRVAFTVDFTGGREFRIFVRSIATGETVDQGIDDASPDLVFAAESDALLYVRNEPTTLRSYQVWLHRLGASPNSDVLIYEESDTTFSVSIGLSKSRKLALININEERTSEFRCLPIDQPTAELRVIEPRRRGVIYEIDHVGDQFFIRTNLDAPDFRLMSAPQATPTALHWREIVPEKPGRHLSHFEAFETFVAVDVEDETGTAIRVFDVADLCEIPVPRPAAIGVASSFFDDNEANLDPAATVLRFHFSNPSEPECVYDFDVTTGALTLRKQDPASRWFDRHRYVLDQFSATAPDGERVPITIVYRKRMRRPGGNPTLIVGYGAYGLSLRADFSQSVISLIDRGFLYAIAHVRGGHEKGERWYAEGRMLNKRNTFTDFIAVAETLIAKGYSDSRAIFAQGGSAGGLLMGAIANLRPDLFAGIVAEVPFVDIVTTMSDASAPLTTLEYDEWGNPAIEPEYNYMLSYSPYDNVAQTSYPPMFVTAGFYDSQVNYAEPAKWVAKLRANKTDTHDLVFKTDMTTGHNGRSGRLDSIKESAEIMGWLIAHARDGAPS